MDLVPDHRALLGIDVVGSSANPGYHLNPMWEAVDQMLRTALDDCGVRPDEVATRENTGDGALLTLPGSRVGTLLDLTVRLDELTAQHNRWRKPDVRLRIAIELGPVGDRDGYYRPKITHARLLNAAAFKTLLARCVEEGGPGLANTAVIVSDHAMRSAFSGDHTRMVKETDFALFTPPGAEFPGSAWVRVPGFDARSITRFAEHAEPAPSTARPEARVHNHVGGNMNGVQAGTINGGVTFGVGHR